MRPGLIRWCPHEKRDKDTDTHRGGPHPLGWCPYKGKTPNTCGPQTREIPCEDTVGDSLSMPEGEASGGPAMLHLAVAPAFTQRNHSCHVTTHVWFGAVAA